MNDFQKALNSLPPMNTVKLNACINLTTKKRDQAITRFGLSWIVIISFAVIHGIILLFTVDNEMLSIILSIIQYSLIALPAYFLYKYNTFKNSVTLLNHVTPIK